MAEDEMALFSLELVVDKLFVPNVSCVFPSVAFRLLEFPMITINHVDKELSKLITHKLTKNPDIVIPDQIRELQDNSGTFIMKKGKSCLFKIGLSSLRKQLHVTPLYLIVVDSFCKPPKLVANTTVPLNGLIECIHDDVLKNGNSVPSVHGDRGLYRLFNLMGDEVGYIVIGFRLLSLGPAMAKHLMDNLSNQIAMKSEVNDVNEQPHSKAVSDDTKVAFAEKSKHTKQLNTTFSSVHSFEPSPSKPKDVRNISTNTVLELHDKTVEDCNVTLSNVYTQTDYENKKRRYTQNKLDNKSIDLKIEPDGDHPPPLFYKNNGVKTVWVDKVRRSFDDGCDDISDLESIASDWTDINVIKPNEKVRLIEDIEKAAKTTIDDKCDNREYFHRNDGVITPVVSENDHLKHLLKEKNAQSFYPVLSALINEFAALKENREFQTVHPNIGRSAHDISRVKCTQSSNKLCHKCHNNEDNVMKQPSATESAHSIRSHQDCAIRDDGVPRNKSWIRSTPDVGVKKSKLVFGMTNSQRLRLQKGNPKWLKKVDKHIINAVKPKRIEDPEPLSMASDVSTEIQRNRNPELITTKSDTKQKQNRLETSEKISKKVTSKSDKTKRTKQKIIVDDSESPNFGTTLERVVRALENIDTNDENGQGEIITDGRVDTNKSTESIDVHIPQMDDHSQGDKEGDLSSPSKREISQAKTNKKSTQNLGYTQVISPVKNPSYTLPSLHLIVDKNAACNPITGSESPDLAPHKQPTVGEMRGFALQPISAQESLVMQNTESSVNFQSAEETELRDLVSDDDGLDFGVENITRDENRFDDDHRTENRTDSVSGKSKSSGDKTSVVTALRMSVPNPMLSENSPIPSTRRSVAIPDLSRRDSLSSDSYKRPTPRPRLAKLRESINTESLSTYAPSDANNVSVGSEDTYSEDFHEEDNKGDNNDGKDDIAAESSSVDDMDIDDLLANNQYIPSTKLGYTIW